MYLVHLYSNQKYKSSYSTARTMASQPISKRPKRESKRVGLKKMMVIINEDALESGDKSIVFAMCLSIYRQIQQMKKKVYRGLILAFAMILFERYFLRAAVSGSQILSHRTIF